MNMKNTIEAGEVYRVKKGTNTKTNEKVYCVYDGEFPVMVCKRRKFAEFLDELAQNECAKIYEVFTTEKGNQFIYWRDDEADVDYLTQAPNEGLFSA